jgi:hypothetical protein
MANTNNPIGAKAIGSIIAANLDLKLNTYYLPASDTDNVFRDDVVAVTGESNEDGIPIARRAAADEDFRGYVAGFSPQKEYENILYRKGSTDRIVYVADSPFILVEMQVNGLIDETAIGKNADIILNGGELTTGISKTQLDITTISTDGRQFKILRIIERVDNSLGEYTKVMCIAQRHDLIERGVEAEFVTANQSKIYYAGNNGDNSNDGKSIQTRKLTLDSAITAASSESPSVSNRLTVKCIDAGIQNKFTLGGGGFLAVEAPYTGFDVVTTSSSPDGIVVADGYSVDLGFIRHLSASNQAGILLKAAAGPNATQVRVKQIASGTIYDNVLFESAGDTVFAEIADLRHIASRDRAAIFVSDGVLHLSGSERLRGKIIVGASKTAYISCLDCDSDLAVETNGVLHINGRHWNGQVINAAAGAKIFYYFDEHDIPGGYSPTIHPTAKIQRVKSAHDMCITTATIKVPTITKTGATTFSVGSGC